MSWRTDGSWRHAPRRWRRWLGLALVPACTTSAPAVARAQEAATTDDSEVASESAALRDAKDSFRRGVALLGTEDYERALRYFLESRSRYPSKHNTQNAAICLERLGRLGEALDMYEEALTTHPEELDDQEVAALSDAMKELAGKTAGLNVSASAPCRVFVDGRPRGVLPSHRAIRVTPGSHVLRLAADGFETFEAMVSVRAGETVTLDARLNRSKAALLSKPALRIGTLTPPALFGAGPGRPPTIDRGRGTSWVTYAGLSVGGLGVVAGTVTGLMSASKTSSIKRQCDGTTCPVSEQDEADSAQRLATVSNVSFAVGLSAIAIGIITAVASDEDPDDRHPGSGPDVVFGPSGLGGSF